MDFLDGPRDAVHDFLDMAGKDAAFGGQGRELLTAVKELDAEFFFEAADSVCDSRLRDIEAFGRSRETARFADG